MRTFGTAVLALLVVGGCASEVAAQDSQNVQVIPYIGVGTEAASPIGTAVTFPLTPTFSLETDVAYRRGEGRIHALSSSASLLYSLPRIGKATPYLAAGVGLQQYGTPVLAPTGPPIGTKPRVAMTINAGGGLAIPMNESLGLRTDARWFKSLGQDGNEQFRVAHGLAFGAKR